MLIASPRHTARDLEQWRAWERQDATHCQMRRFRALGDKALDELDAFAALAGCYAGVSWGKDSTVLAHLVARAKRERGISIPLVWIKLEPAFNPDCPEVRDAFLATHDVDYHEIVVGCPRGDDGRLIGTGRLERGFALAIERWGDRHVSGVRGAESAARRLRMRIHGVSSAKTCAPIGWWSGGDVFAYLHAHDLPVHPAYAMSLGGQIHRDRLRVSSIGGERGTAFGRRVLEETYYRDALRAIERGL